MDLLPPHPPPAMNRVNRISGAFGQMQSPTQPHIICEDTPAKITPTTISPLCGIEISQSYTLSIGLAALTVSPSHYLLSL